MRLMASNVAAGPNRHPPLARGAVGLLALAVLLLACFQVAGIVDLLREDSRGNGAGEVVALLSLQVLSIAVLGAAAWFLGRFIAGYRPKWLLSAGLVIAGLCLSVASWAVWLGEISGG